MPDYGVMYFNMNDPNVAQQNIPQKQENSNHPSIIVGSIILWAAIILVAAGSNNFLTGAAVGIIFAISYIVYLCCVCCCNDIKGYITNLKKFDEYATLYQSMVDGKGFFRFWI